MRPVCRGPQPDGLDIKQWGDALEGLVERIGDYCSYCEMPLPNGPQVEHVKPKKHFPEDALNWENFLLACGYCNGTKKDNPQDDCSNYIWPDKDNPLVYLEYVPDAVPQIRATSDQEGHVAATLCMIGLTRDANSKPRATKKDVRWRKRRDAWWWALKQRQNFQDYPEVFASPAGRDLLKQAVTKTGFFSVWMAAFSGIAEIQNLILSSFVGTATDCFDQNFEPLPRKKPE